MKNDFIGKGPPRPTPVPFRSCESLLDYVSNQHRSFLIGTGKSLTPMILAVCKNGEVAPPVVCPMGGDIDKAAFVKKCQKMFKRMGVVRYAMFSEAWMANVGQGVERRPSEREDRTEVIINIASDGKREFRGFLRSFAGGRLVGLRTCAKSYTNKANQRRVVFLLNCSENPTNLWEIGRIETHFFRKAERNGTTLRIFVRRSSANFGVGMKNQPRNMPRPR